MASFSADWTICPICLEVFDNPKSLPCIHGFCLRCLEGYFKHNPPGDEVPCPICRKPFKIPSDGLGGLQHHFFIQHLVDARNAASKSPDEVACEVCLEENEGSSEEISTATVYCIDCRQKLCERCSRPHRRMKGGAHQVKPLGAELEQEVIQLGGSYCNKHEDEQVKLYCYDCNENMCVLCFAVSHRNHNSGEIRDLADSFRPRIEEDDENVLSAITTVRQQSEKMKRDASAFACKVEDTKKKVVHAAKAIKCLIDKHAGLFLLRLQSVQSGSAKQFEVVEEELQQAVIALESFHTYSRELLDKGRPSDITGAFTELHKRATELLDNDVISVQYCPPQLTFTPPDITQLTVSQLIGELSVMGNVDELGTMACTPRVIGTEPTMTVPFVEREKLRASDVALGPLQHETIRGTPVKADEQMKQQQKGSVLHILPEGNNVYGVTALDNLLYVLRQQLSEHIEVYDTQSYHLKRCLKVQGLRTKADITSCAHNCCLYISGHTDKCVHRVALPNVDVTKWPVNDVSGCLSVTETHSVLVSCYEVRKIKEFTTHGNLLRQLELPQDVMTPCHAVQLSSGEFITCHGRTGDSLHRVCVVRSNGQVVKSYGGTRGARNHQMDSPTHLAVDRNGFVFVVDRNNCRVLLLSPELTSVPKIVSQDRLQWKPQRLFLDSDRRRLYIAENQWQQSEFSAGRVVVISI